MIELTESHYRDLCRTARVQSEVSTLAGRRRTAFIMFWLLLIGGLGIATAPFWIPWTSAQLVSDQMVFGTVLAIVVGIVTMLSAVAPLSRVSRDLKLPVLETLAAQSGLTYQPRGFDPPVFPEAKVPLFGKAISGETFVDLFQGADAEGGRFAMYEADLTGAGVRGTQMLFSGEVYAFQRRRRGGGQIAIVPHYDAFNIKRAVPGMARVKVDADPEFESKFEVYATHPHEALAQLGTEARRKLLEWPRGRVMAWFGPEDALVAIVGKTVFEPFSIFRSRSGEERVRRMFDNYCASLATFRTLKAILDPAP